MPVAPAFRTRLEKAAADNGFDLVLPPEGDWIGFASSHVPLRVWLTVLGDALFLTALSQPNVARALAELGTPFVSPFPPGACGARAVTDFASLHRLLRRAFLLSRTLPDALWKAFTEKAAGLAAQHRGRVPGRRADRAGRVPRGAPRLRGGAVRDFPPGRARAATREPHQALGRLRIATRSASTCSMGSCCARWRSPPPLAGRIALANPRQPWRSCRCSRRGWRCPRHRSRGPGADGVAPRVARREIASDELLWRPAATTCQPRIPRIPPWARETPRR
jgi:hypothetical protein